MRRLIIGLSGASGAIYGVRTLEALKGVPDIETHLVLSPSAKRTIVEETDWKISAVEALADVVHRHGDIGAAVASGSFITAGMIVAPCSIKTLSEIANSHCSNLMARVADVCLKEGRRLVLLVREIPLHLGTSNSWRTPPVMARFSCRRYLPSTTIRKRSTTSSTTRWVRRSISSKFRTRCSNAGRNHRPPSGRNP